MIRNCSGFFILDAGESTYAFHVLPTGQLEHLYYGSRLSLAGTRAEREFLREQGAPPSCDMLRYGKSHPGVDRKSVV